MAVESVAGMITKSWVTSETDCYRTEAKLLTVTLTSYVHTHMPDLYKIQPGEDGRVGEVEWEEERAGAGDTEWGMPFYMVPQTPKYLIPIN